MVRRGSQIFAVSVLVIGLALTGCAKRPATTQATAPAPMGAAGATDGGTGTTGGTGGTVSSGPGTGAMQSDTAGTPGGSGTTSGGAVAGATTTPGAGATTTSPSGTARPVVKEYAAVPELRDIHFDFDRYDVRPGDAKVLDANAQWLRTNPGHLVLIEGHCDERGTNEYNLALGERRAKSAMNYLVSQGVQANRITIISYGEERPACTEKNEECWSQNRRAHFLVKPR